MHSPVYLFHFSYSCHFSLRKVLTLMELSACAGGEMHLPFYTFKLLKRKELWLRGVDLNHPVALIPRKLLILQHAKLTQLAKRAIPSYTFLTLQSPGQPPALWPPLRPTLHLDSIVANPALSFPRNCFE